MKTLLGKACVILPIVISSTIANAKEFLPPTLAFKPILEGNMITIKIAEGYYLYQDKISLQSQGKEIKFRYLDKAISKNFPKFGTYMVFLDKVQLNILHNPKAPMTIKFQGCSTEGLCYPPQQVIMKAK
ncbi:protein-disulfide reductase DsbD N-terminal domain-containing protein [Acinetobacter baumannii]